MQTVTDAANAVGIPVGIALAQANRESGFNDRAVGYDGERGLMQPLPSTWAAEMPGVSFDLAFDPQTNLIFWQRYFGKLLRQFGDYERALQAYNGGPGHVQRGTVSAMARNYARAILSAADSYTPQSQTGADAASNESPSETPSGSGYFLPITIGALLLFFILTGDD